MKGIIAMVDIITNHSRLFHAEEYFVVRSFQATATDSIHVETNPKRISSFESSIYFSIPKGMGD